MPESKRRIRERPVAETENSPSSDTSEVASSAAVTPEPPSDQDIEDDENPALGESLELPEQINHPYDEEMVEPPPQNVPPPAARVVAPRRSWEAPEGRSRPNVPLAVALRSGQAVAGSSRFGRSVSADSSRSNRIDIDSMLTEQTGVMDRLNLLTSPVPPVDPINRPSLLANARRTQRAAESSARVSVPVVANEGRIPDESDFFAAGPSRPPVAVVEDVEMELASTRRKRSPKLLLLVCERCGDGFSGLKIPPRRPHDESTPGQLGAGAGSNSDSGSSSSRASSPAICPTCLPFEPPRSYSNPSLPSAGSLSSALDMAGAPNITIDSSQRHDLPEYSTERIPSAPPPVLTPVSPQRRSASSGGGSYDPFSENRRLSDSHRYSHALPGPSSSTSQYSRTSPSSRPGSSAQTAFSPQTASSRPGSSAQTAFSPRTASMMSPVPGPSSGQHVMSPTWRSGAGTEFPAPGSSSRQSTSPLPPFSPGSRRSPSIIFSPVNVPRRASGGRMSQSSPNSRNPHILVSPRVDTGPSSYYVVSPEHVRRFGTSVGSPPVQRNPPRPPSQIGIPRNLMDAAATPTPGQILDSFWAGGDRDSRLGSPERRQQPSPSHGSGGRRPRSGGSSASGGASAMRPTVMSPGRVAPYGSRRRYLTGENEGAGAASDENVPLLPGVYRRSDSNETLPDTTG